MKQAYSKNNLPSNKSLKKIAEFLKIISEENRLRIISILNLGPRCVCEIWQYLKLPQNLVSHHLKMLKDFNLIFSKKEGLKVFYQLNSEVVKRYIKLLNKFFPPKADSPRAKNPKGE